MIPKHFSLVKEHPQSYEIHDKRDGSKFHVAKAGLDLAMHGKLAKIQHFADGGVVGEEIPYDKLLPQEAAQSAPYGTSMIAQAPIMQQPAQPQPVVQYDVPNVMQIDEQAPPAPAQPAAPGYDKTVGQSQQVGLLDKQIGAVQDIGNQRFKVAQDYAKDVSKMETPDQITQRHQLGMQALQKDIADNKIDPNRMWHDMSTGSKIAAGIGMIFGGMGAAMAGQPNYAAEIIQKAIDRDIEAQKQDKSNKMNLYKMNMDSLQNEIAANLATRNQKLAAVDAMMKGLEAKAQGTQGAAALGMERAKLEQEIRLNSWKIGAAVGAPQSEAEYLQRKNGMALVDKDLHKQMDEKYIPGVGVSKIPLSQNERDSIIAFSALNKQIDDAIHFAKSTGYAMPFSQDAAKASAITNGLIAGGQTLTGLSRLNHYEMGMFSDNVAGIGGMRSDLAIARLMEMKHELNNKASALTNQVGLTPFPEAQGSVPGQMGARERQFADWARKNPNDPRSALILEKLGVR